jgi:shikimate kinase
VPSDNDQRRPIVIIGFMGTGKTTVGRLVAERLGRRFLDLDSLVESTAGRPIADIFRSEGEAGFRRLESESLARALGEPGVVLATGGGAACREPNLTTMLERGRVVALSISAEEAVRRVGKDPKRPLIHGATLEQVRELLAAREPFYDRAHVRVDTAGRKPDEVAAEVIAALGAGKGESS